MAKTSRSRRNPRNRGPLRVMTALLAIVVLVFGGLAAARIWGEPAASLTPQLGLDLAGGRQIVIEPVVEGGTEVSTEQVTQAIDIIRRRIDGGGVAEAEVSRLGQQNISVAIPGNPSAAQLEALSRSSQLSFRPVLVAEPTAPQPELEAPPFLPLPDDARQEQLDQLQQPDPAAPTTDPSAPTVDPATPTGDAPATDDAEQTNGAPAGLHLPGPGMSAAVPAQDGADVTGDAESPTAPPGSQDPAEPAEDPSSLGQVTPELREQFDRLDCTPAAEGEDTQEDGAQGQDSSGADAGSEGAMGQEGAAQEVAAAPEDEPVVACAADGFEKYILGPVELTGAQVDDATSGLATNQTGQTTGQYEVRLEFDGEGGSTFSRITSRLMGFGQGATQNRFAILLDGSVISAPGVNSQISNGSASITGNFTADSSEQLANQLKFGALPISFSVLNSEQVSPTLGGEQLRLGIIAGIIGLLMVFAYSVAQYRALGLVTISSLVVAGVLAYGTVTFLGWSSNFRLTMAGVTGLIVAIGITADSFIVYFERVRDEVRAGRPLRYAVDTGWDRARRTILISDAVNLIAAGVLYWLSESSVKAFAFALGLTTLIDLLVVFMFTHPVVSILANTKFFGQGHRWSGMDPERLGAKRSTYLGRGQFNLPPVKVRPSRAEIEGGVV
ncbi:MAG: protein translocase subunit SecD [Actinobacteria bacterium]|nr:protein translocase subunit SecD [Actinomycetota bacterium]